MDWIKIDWTAKNDENKNLPKEGQEVLLTDGKLYYVGSYRASITPNDKIYLWQASNSPYLISPTPLYWYAIDKVL